MTYRGRPITLREHGPVVLVALALTAGASALILVTKLAAQNAGSSPNNLTPIAAVASWLAFDAPPGEETRITDAVMAADSHWRRDALGNLVMTVGSGHPRRLVACGLDHVGFVVSEITDQGYLRLRRAGNAATHPLWDQFHQAQQIRVLTKDGSVPGVVAVDNLHFANEHRGDTAVVNVDQLWVDIGVRSRAEATALGVSLIDPVVRDLPAWPYADYVAGADASGRAGCAAIASVARAAEHDTRSSGETVFMLSAQSSFGGVAGALGRLGKFDEVTLVYGASVPERFAALEVEGVRRFFSVPLVTSVRARARFAGSLVESVRVSDLDSLLAAVRTATHVTSSPIPWLALARPSATRSARATDSLSATADILTRLADLPAVGDREVPVRNAIRSALPAWARKEIVQDSAGNLILAMGPDRDTSVFVAHVDEVGYTVRSIDHDGMVTLAPQGGMNGAAWEGQPALLWLDRSTSDATESVAPASLAGVFVPREQATLRRPDVMRAWFGMDSAALAMHGVRAGLAVTAYKRGERLAATRFTARALDDRAGDTALLLALAGMDPAKLKHKVIFVWSVEEEIGSIGAWSAADHMGTSVHHAYAIDTFVSSDTPLESPLFAFAPLGHGPVLIAMDDQTIVVRSERERILALARNNHIRLQVGTTKGGSDAGPFAASGAIAGQLGWPGRYSHSPAEVLDLNDLKSLARLVRVLAQ
jgi:putative aminopeptidase FrvX